MGKLKVYPSDELRDKGAVNIVHVGIQPDGFFLAS
jgi:hypothetical protein